LDPAKKNSVFSHIAENKYPNSLTYVNYYILELNTKQRYIYSSSLFLRNLIEFRKHTERNIQRSNKKYF